MKYMRKLSATKKLTRNLMCTHGGNKESCSFTPAELLDFCQIMFVEFADHATRLTKVAPDNEYYWKMRCT